MIYFDYAATTPMDPRVLEEMQPYFFEGFANASSPHSLGQASLKGLEDARKITADLIGAKSEEIVFNSGATEGNNHSILGVADALKTQGNHVIVSPIEHHSVLEPIEKLHAKGFKVSYLKVDECGLIDPEELNELITDETILIAVMNASNEIGTVQPIEKIGALAKKKGVTFLVDAVQAVGHIPVNVEELNADLLSFCAHKFYGPKGIGGLYIRKGTKISSLLLGGDQERGLRASTQNVSGAVGLASALKICIEQMEDEKNIQTSLRDKLINEIPKKIIGTKVNGHLNHRVPNNAHFSFEGVSGESLLMSLDMNGIAASMGSACTSGAMAPSHVLKAIGLDDDLAFGSLRLTIGRWTKEKDIDELLEKLPGCIESLRN